MDTTKLVEIQKNNRSFLRSSDNIYACLMAGAIGDALGYTVEFDSYSSIQKRFGSGGISAPVPSGKKALISDDTQMTLFTNRALTSAYRSESCSPLLPVENYVYEKYLCWLNTQGYASADNVTHRCSLNDIPELNSRRAPGNTCLNALSSGEMGTLESPINTSKGCGGVMRTAPLGFDARFGDPAENGAKCAAITHGHPMGWIPAGMLSDIVFKAIYRDYADLETLIRDSFSDIESMYGDVSGFAAFGSMIDAAISLSRSDIPDERAISLIGEGWVGDEALAVAVYCCLKHCNDLKSCLISAVNHSGDSDSTGAIAGNILGAWLGGGCIPSDWESITELSDLIRREADDMVQCILNDYKY